MKVPMYPRYDVATNKAFELLMDCRVKDVPIHPLKLAEILDYTVETYSELAEENNTTVENVALCFGSDDGVSLLDDGYYVIAYNDQQQNDRIRFTLMHEIGHIYLGHFLDFEATKLLRCSISDSEYQVLEKEVNCFARNVLSPLPVVESLQNRNVTFISDIFDISLMAANTRLRLIASDIYHSSQELYGTLLNWMSDSIFRVNHSYDCNHCHARFVLSAPTFCPICGSDKISRTFSFLGGGFMEYSKIVLNKNGLPDKCPKCGANITGLTGPYCPICGTYIFNQCTGLDENEYEQNFHGRVRWDQQKGCDGYLPGYARFCPTCGCTTTFYEQGLLKNWEVENREKAQKEFKDKGLRLADVSEDSLPF